MDKIESYSNLYIELTLKSIFLVWTLSASKKIVEGFDFQCLILSEFLLCYS